MRFLVVDDHVLIREAMTGVLHQLRPGCDVLTALDANTALQVLEANPDFDLVLLDLNLPDNTGFNVLTIIAAQYPSVPVAVLSAHSDTVTIREALKLGAQGYIAKAEPRDVLVQALGLILAGGSYVPRIALGSANATTSATPSLSSEQSPTPQALGLTDRQLDVLALLMEGKNNKLICRELDLAEPTVKNHISGILKGLGVSSRTEAVLAVTKLGWSLPKPMKQSSRDV